MMKLDDLIAALAYYWMLAPLMVILAIFVFGLIGHGIYKLVWYLTGRKPHNPYDC